MTPDQDDNVEDRRAFNTWCIRATTPELRQAVAEETGVRAALAARHIAHRDTTDDLARVRRLRSELHWEITRLVSLGDKA